MSPARRQIASALREALDKPIVRIVQGEIQSVNSTTREVVMKVGPANVRTWVPSSLTLPAVGDILQCLDSGGRYWPFAWNSP